MRARVLGGWLLVLSAMGVGCGGGDDGSPAGAGGSGGEGAAGQGGAGQGAGSQGGAGGAGGDAGGGVAGAGGAGQGGSGGSGSDCVFGDDCGPGLYCATLDCGSGVCSPRPNPASLPPEQVPVCGCDGNSYWNVETAAWLGVPVMASGACAAGTPCGQGAPCPGALKCSRQVADGASCGGAAAGTCWGLPLLCDLAGAAGRACIGGTCELMCSLIQGQNPWYADATCP